MPLMHGKSKKAFQHNIKAEVHAGKPQKQAVAIAFSEKRRAAERKHKASGGCIGHGCSHHSHYDDGGKVPAPSTPADSSDNSTMKGVGEGVEHSGGFPSLDVLADRVKHAFDPAPSHPAGMAEGGEVHHDNQMHIYAMDPDVPAMHPKTMAEGGELEPEMEGENEMHEAVAGELMDALERKDKKQILESMKAIVMACGGKV
jgi:hypothetical protein